MSFNVQTFKTRALTAVVFAAVMLIGLFWNPLSFIVLFSIIHFGCWYEFVKLMRKIYKQKYVPYCLLGLMYITLPLIMIINLRLDGNVNKGHLLFAESGKIIPCVIIFSIWINDTMAYIVGSFIGKTPFSTISPKKTWEGTIGGAVLCIILISLLACITNTIPLKTAAIIAFICAIFGTLGDLLESKLKRMAGVKDSGSLMPGHGGFLDRFDSLLVSTPFVWLYVKLFL
jgi:phosphatidate cytidylyltransferase